MPDPRLYQSDTYVFLEPGQPEQFLTETEALDKLQTILTEHPEELPPDVKRLSSIHEQAKYLLETCCDLPLGSGQSLQWYMVRLEKN
jgi:hypothetical protein